MSLFPLPLAPFEEYMLRDDRRAYPMQGWCRLRLEGRVEREALAAAFAATMARHPLMAATVVDEGSRLVWVPVSAEAIARELRWCDESLLANFGPLPAMDLRKEPGGRLFVAAGETRTTLLFQMHHTASDGMGLFAFLADLLLEYHARVSPNEQPAPLPQRDAEALVGRARFGLAGWNKVWQILKLVHGLPNTIRFVTHRASPLLPAAPLPDEAADGSYQLGAATHEFTAEATDRLRQAARWSGATLNDLLIRDVLLAIDKWRSRRRISDPGRWLRISVPVNLRLEADSKLPSANVVSMIFIDRRGSLLARPEALLASVNRQMTRIKRYRLGLIFPLLVAVLQRVGRISAMLSSTRCRATCVLTNLGEPFAGIPLSREGAGRILAGGLTLLGWEILAPLRPLTQVAIALFVYAGRLNLNLHYDRRLLTAADARELLADYAAACEGSAAT